MPRVTSSARSGSCSRLRKAAAALPPSWSIWCEIHSASSRLICRMPTASNTLAAVSVRPTARRRGRHSLRGLPMTPSAMGAPTITPRTLPSHQVVQVAHPSAGGRRPACASSAEPMLAEIRQAATPPPLKNSAMSRGSLRISGPPIQRRTSQLPTIACRPDEIPMPLATSTNSGNGRAAVASSVAATIPADATTVPSAAGQP